MLFEVSNFWNPFHRISMYYNPQSSKIIPYNIYYKYGHICPVRRADVNPVYGVDTEHAQKVVDDTQRFRICHTAAAADVPNNVEHCLEYHADCNRVGYVGQEENRL